jgi:hypothetical protein
MKQDYTLTELQDGIDSTDIVWSDSSNLPIHKGDSKGLPQGFEFPALCKMASIIKMTYPTRPIMEKLFPKGFIIKMETSSYSTFQIISK